MRVKVKRELLLEKIKGVRNEIEQDIEKRVQKRREVWEDFFARKDSYDQELEQ